MASTYSLKLVGKNNKVVDRRSVKLAAGKFVGPETVKAQPDVMYHLSAEDHSQALDKIITKKVGKDLHLSFLDDDINPPDLVIEDYFEFNPDIRLIL
ncbi:hypothetical protein B9Z36_02110 [Limnohabitans sp. Rim8]|jgi:hypothetical protein|uniref:hypothetical protein n=1 Tax=Limnohabitans sp. Rim8 TaxID=1100718 RepID=UPI000D3A3F10|nr:hypothetical protein [Limnohabitans sp. Rim8]PUE62125.1 hypothetical protein B9Z36_02110 [Limnohabitans sp. Rim8]